MVGRLIRCVVVSTSIAIPALTAAAGDVDYTEQIKPLLRERCYACHGSLKQESGLRLDTAALMLEGGDSGAVIVPGDLEKSLLLERVTAAEAYLRMPPEGEGEPLTPEQIALLKEWVKAGAPAPEGEQPQADPQIHWAFQPVVRPPLPEVRDPSWVNNPIDAFIAAKHEQHGLISQPEAGRRTWLRRVSIDLVGLPPTPEELDAFVADQADDAYDRVVTRLLDSPEYGQRWGRHWMDIWRYSDWWGLGAEVRHSQKHIWHWRDWIIESLNDDKSYDQMLREMLAADELYPNDLDRMRASGFLARQYFIFNRTSWLDETVEHTAKAMLGLTINCAKCHDHKYDPVSQVDYYALRAIFEPYQVRTEMLPGESDFAQAGLPRAFDAHLDEKTYLHIRGDDRNPDKSNAIEPAVPEFLSSDGLRLEIEPVELPVEAANPGLRSYVVEAHREAAEQEVAEAQTALEVAATKFADAEAAGNQNRELTEAAAGKSDQEVAADGVETAADGIDLLVQDDFSIERTDVWETLTGQWRYRNGRLGQLQTGAVRTAIRLKDCPPTDFEARLKYTPTGGEKWKSVGISFDVTAGGNEILAYASAVAGGGKAQLAYRQDGRYVYPPGAGQARDVELNQPHKILLRVRGGLINVWVDGDLVIATHLPEGLSRQKEGFLELITFDASAEFDSFELRALPEELKLAETDERPRPAASPTSVDELRLAVTVAERTLAAAEVQRASIELRAAADRACFRSSETEDSKAACVAAARSECELAVARAEEALSRDELALLKVADAAKGDAEKKVAAAKTALEKARENLETPGEMHTPLPGALKTKEHYQDKNKVEPFPATSSGRRTALANWLTDPRNPLPARVAVNHIWSRHMGEPLVPSVFDFGLNGKPPTHPELLDWLAAEFVDHGWSMKHIHRLITTSHAYRLSSSSAAADADTVAADPDNHRYWRMNPIRMEAEVIRDSLLSLAGELDTSLGGPSIPINADSHRRSLYFVHSHNDHQQFLSMFDNASVLECYRRDESIIPQQALALENSEFVVEIATKIADRIATEHQAASDQEFIRTAFVTVLAYEPSESEQTLVAEMLTQLADTARAANRPDPDTQARIAVIQSLLNHNDFVTIR